MLYGYGPIRSIWLGQQKWSFFEDDDTILILWWCFILTINLGVHLFSTLRNPNITWDVGVFSCIDEILHKLKFFLPLMFGLGLLKWLSEFSNPFLAVDTPTYVSYICLHDQVELCHILSAYLQSVISFSYPYIAYICVVVFLLVSTWTSPWKKKLESTGLNSKLPKNQR